MGRFTPPSPRPLDQGYAKCVLCGGRLWPESYIVRHEGKLYCREHYAAKIGKEKLDEVRFNFKEEKADL